MLPTRWCILAEVSDSQEGVEVGPAAEGEALHVSGPACLHGLERYVAFLVHGEAKDHTVTVVASCSKAVQE